MFLHTIHKSDHTLSETERLEVTTLISLITRSTTYKYSVSITTYVLVYILQTHLSHYFLLGTLYIQTTHCRRDGKAGSYYTDFSHYSSCSTTYKYSVSITTYVLVYILQTHLSHYTSSWGHYIFLIESSNLTLCGAVFCYRLYTAMHAVLL